MESNTPAHGEPLSPSLEALHHRLLEDLQVDTRIAADTLFNQGDRIPLPFQLGRFQLLEQIGEGGQGTVYRAYDPNKAATVAIKVLNTTGQFWDSSHKARFRREAQLTSRISDPHVASVLEASQVDGVSYLVMPFCPGPSLAVWLRSRPGQPVPMNDAVNLARALTDAMVACHARGVLHRDLKPANVLLFPKADVTSNPAELSEYIPRVCDFGLPRAEDSGEAITGSHTVLGTRAYMSPEQSEGILEEVGVATDIWALGVILYELLTGQQPFGDDSKTLIRILTGEPIAPRQLNPQIPKDLEAIVVKCLTKNLHHRYGTAAALAEDLDRFLKSKPTIARPLGWAGRVQRWVRRRPLVASGVVVSLVLLGMATAGIALHYRSVEHLNIQLGQALDAAQKRIYREEIRRGAELLRQGDETALFALLQRLKPAPGQPDHRDFSWRYLAWRLGDSRYTQQMVKGTLDLCYAPDGQYFATISTIGQVRIWDALSAELISELAIPDQASRESNVSRVLISPQQRWLLALLPIVTQNEPSYRLFRWDLQNTKEAPLALDIGNPRGCWNGLQFADDGKTLLISIQSPTANSNFFSSVAIHSIDVEHLQVRHKQTIPGGQIFDIAADPDGITWWALTASTLPTASLTRMRFQAVHFDPHDGFSPQAHFLRDESIEQFRGAAYNPRYRRLAVARTTKDISQVVEYEDQQSKPLWTNPFAYSGTIWEYRLRYSKDGKELFVSNSSNEIDKALPVAGFWRSGSGEPELQHQVKSEHGVTQLIRNPVTGEIAIACYDGIIHLLPASHSKSSSLSLTQSKQNAPVWSLSFQPDGLLVSCGDFGMTRLWNIAERKQINNLTKGAILNSTSAALPKTTHSLIVGDYAGQVRLLDTKTGLLIKQWSATTPSKIRSLTASVDGRWVVAGGKSDQLWIWDRQLDTVLHRKHGHPDSIRALAILGSQLFTGCEGGFLYSSDVVTGEKAWETCSSEEIWCMVATSAFDKLIVTGNSHGHLNWNAANSGKFIRTSNRAHPGGIHALAISPDNMILASAGEDHVIKLWDLSSGEELLTLAGHNSPVYALAFSPDGKYLVSGDTGGQILLWPTVSD